MPPFVEDEVILIFFHPHVLERQRSPHLENFVEIELNKLSTIRRDVYQ